MAEQIEICLEELDALPEDECFVRCVAISGGQPGLALDRDGLVRWMPAEEEACHGLWVTQDGRLALQGADTPGGVEVERGRRCLSAPAGQPVILIDQDLLRVGDRRLLVHIHGETEELYEPERLTRSAMLRFLQAAAAAASITLGGVALAAGPAPSPTDAIGQPPPIEVRRRPPAPVRRISLLCSITRQSTQGGKLQVEAKCQSTKRLYVGMYGSLVRKKTGNPVTKGTVKITSIKGTKIKVEASSLKKPVKAADRVRFYVRP